MTIKYLKKASKSASTDDNKTRDIVQNLLKELENSKEEGCKELTKKFDKYDGEIVVSKEKIEEIKKNLDQKTKDDIKFSYDRVRKFAEAQLANYGKDFEVELSNGLYAGQKLVPIKYRRLLYPRWKICTHCICSNECYNCKSCRC